MRGRSLLLLSALLLAASLAPAQWPGLPDRSGPSPGQEPSGTQRSPFPGQAPGGGRFGHLPQVPLPGEGPQGTAPRTGSGRGLWEALTAMAREDSGGPGAEGSLESRPDRALMLRYTDEVALRKAGESGWDILPWWRKIHTLSAALVLRLDGRGRALLAFHDGAALECRGAGQCEILGLDRDAVHLRFEAVGTLTLDARERPFRFELPGGYTLVAAGALVQVRTVAPQRLRVDNLGPAPAVLQDGERELPLEWNQSCFLPCFSGQAPARPLAPGPGAPSSLGEGLWRLSWKGQEPPETVGGGWRLEAGSEPGWLKWGQAGFGLPPGARLRLVGPKVPERTDQGT